MEIQFASGQLVQFFDHARSNGVSESDLSRIARERYERRLTTYQVIFNPPVTKERNVFYDAPVKGGAGDSQLLGLDVECMVEFEAGEAVVTSLNGKLEPC